MIGEGIGGRKRRAALKEGSGGRSESGSVPHTQYLFEVVGETQAAAEGCGSCDRWEGRTRCSCRETKRSPRGRKGNTGERRRERGKDRGTGGGISDGMEHQPPGHLGDSRTMSFAVARFVQEGGVPARREIGSGVKVACLRG
jgi:hypothetical protein